MPNYLYNGVELQSLPEYDNSLYPYAVLYNESDRIAIAYSTSPWWHDESTSWCNSVHCTQGNAISGAIKYTTDNGVTWTEGITVDKATFDYLKFQAEKLFWANHNIVNSNDEIYLAASDPVPVLSLTERDLYRKINGKPTKLTLYKKVGGKLIPLDEHTKEVKT